MSDRRDLHHRLVRILEEFERERQYKGLKRYVRSLKRKGPLNGEEKFIFRGTAAYLNRLQADRRARSLRLTPYIPFNERMEEQGEPMQGSFLVWDRTIDSYLYTE